MKITCGKGWEPLIQKTLNAVYEIDPNAKIGTAKEKFGYLAFDVAFDYYNKEIEDILFSAEKESKTICELCGKPGTINLDKFGFWLKCYCESCREEENKKIVIKVPELKHSKKTIKNAKRNKNDFNPKT